MNKIIEKYLGLRRKFLTTTKPKVLTFESLRFGFIIWLGSFGISGLCFLLENVAFTIKLKCPVASKILT